MVVCNFKKITSSVTRQHFLYLNGLDTGRKFCTPSLRNLLRSTTAQRPASGLCVNHSLSLRELHSTVLTSPDCVEGDAGGEKNTTDSPGRMEVRICRDVKMILYILNCKYCREHRHRILHSRLMTCI